MQSERSTSGKGLPVDISNQRSHSQKASQRYSQNSNHKEEDHPYPLEMGLKSIKQFKEENFSKSANSFKNSDNFGSFGLKRYALGRRFKSGVRQHGEISH